MCIRDRDGTIPATPYVHEGNPLTGTGSTLFTTEQGKSIEGYLYKFSDGRDYGVVDTAGTCWSYTPNAAAAGKTVTICLKAWSGGSVSNEIQFSVRVNTVPQPAKDVYKRQHIYDARQQALHLIPRIVQRMADGGAAVRVPGGRHGIRLRCVQGRGSQHLPDACQYLVPGI